MEFSEDIAKVFCLLRTARPELFSRHYLDELEAILAPLPDDPAALDQAISAWCLKYPEIKYAIYTMPAIETDKSAGLDDVRFPKNTQPDAKARIQDERLQKADILNAIRQAVPPPPPAPHEK